MRNLLVCLVMLSSTAFAEVLPLQGRPAQLLLNDTSAEVASFIQGLKMAGKSACDIKGRKTLTANFLFKGKQVKNDFYFGARNGVDTSVSVDEASQTVIIKQGLLFTTNSLYITYSDKVVSSVEMVVAQGTEIETVVNCNSSK